MTAPKTTETPEHAPADQDAGRLPWAAPMLGVYDATRMTQGASDQSSDGFINTHS